MAYDELNELSSVADNNGPAGSDVIGATLDNQLRGIKANIARSAREESTATASAAATLAVTVLNKIVPVSGSAGGSTTITLPAAATAGAGFRFTAWKTDNTNNVIIDADGAETINGAANYTLAAQYEAAQFVTDGTSWIVESTAKREIGSADIADGSITTAKLAASAVTADKLGTDSVTAAKIAADAVGSSEIASGAVGETELASDSVSSAKIQANAVGASEIASGAVGTSELSNDSATNAKLANMAQDRIKGRATAGTGDPEDLTASQVRTMLSVYDQSTSDSRYVNVSGDTMTGDLSFGDNDKAIFGAGSDLQIYHDGTNSYIGDTGPGHLGIATTGTKVIINKSPFENMAEFIVDGAVKLYHNNIERFATTSGGIDVTGGVNVTGIVDATAGFQFGADDNYLYQSATDAVTIRVGTRPTFFTFNDLGASTGVRFNSTSSPLYLGAGSNNHVKISAGETVVNEDNTTMDFRVESLNNAHILFVDASANRVGIGDNAPSYHLDVYRSAGGTAARIRSGGSVGVAPSTTHGEFVVESTEANMGVQILGTSTSNQRILFSDTDAGGAGQIIYDHVGDHMALITDGSERLRINSSGNVGINNSAPTQALDVSGSIKASGDVNITGRIGATDGGYGTSGQVLSSTVTGIDWVTPSSGDVTGTGANNGVAVWSGSKSLDFSSTFTWDGSTLVAGSTGASTITTRAYIYYNGAGTQYGINMRPASDNTVSIHFQNASGTNVGSISQTASATTYTTTSDYRIKDNVVVLSGAIERVKQLKPKRFNFTATPDVTVDGFLAHEAQAVVPEAITGAKDAVDQDGQPKLQGIDQSKIVPLLTAALQEAVTKIESLEARITALEAN